MNRLNTCPDWCVDHLNDVKDPNDPGLHQTRTFGECGPSAVYTPDGGLYRWHVGYLDVEFRDKEISVVANDLRAYASDLCALADHLDEIGGQG